MSTDRVVIITGGSRGIGRATAIAAASRGFKICVARREWTRVDLWGLM